MSTYKERVVFTLKGLKHFWTEYKQTKRGVVGFAIICIYIALGILGPILSPHDALNPSWPGYYPAGRALIADYLTLPGWYRYLPGGGGLSENTKLIQDHEFSTEQAMNAWKWETNAPNFANLKYNPVKGDRNEGAMEVTYLRETGATPLNKTYVRITHDFRWPYRSHPRQFWLHASTLVNGTVSLPNYVEIEFMFHRTQAPPPLADYEYPLVSTEDSLVVYTYPLITETISSPSIAWYHQWIRSKTEKINLDPKYYLQPETVIFPAPGNYTYEIKVSFQDSGGLQKNITVYLDNLDVLLYGETYGILGTDRNLGYPRDIATSLMYGARISIAVGLIAASISVSLGLLLGLIAGYIGGVTDEAVMRIADLLIALPGLPLIIILTVVLSSSIWNVIVILSFLGWMGFSRNVRSMTLSLRERAFIEAAKAAGAGRFHIIFKHILPNVFALVYLALAVSVPGIIVAEATLSWLGLFDPYQISWGRMLGEFSNSGVAVSKGFAEYWFWVMPPGLAISMLAIAFILTGYSLDEILNPKLRARR